jgi:hypothetical protein
VPVAVVRPRGRIAVIVGVALLVALYIVVVALYAVSGQVEGPSRPDPDGRHVQLEIQPQSVDAVGQRIPATLEVTSGGSLDPDNVERGSIPVLSDDLEVLVTGTDGTRNVTFPADQVLSPVSLRFIADGEVERWPFDTYTVTSTIFAYRTVDGVAQRLAAPEVFATGSVPGWTMTADLEDLHATIETDAGRVPVDTLVITAHRSGATIAFGIVLLALMVAMPVLVLIVAITVFRGRRKVEASFMSWMGAMLFATIPLRTFLPGSPPIGSWVDFTIVLWVIGALIAGLAIYVAAWLRWSTPAAVPATTADSAAPADERAERDETPSS